MALMISCILALMSAAVPYALAVLLRQMRPRWSRDRTRWLAAAPLAAILAGGSLLLLIDAYASPAQVCGADCRNYALWLGGGGLVLAAMLLLLGLVAAGVALKKDGAGA